MRAVGYRQPGDLNRADALADIELPVPEPTGRDLLVKVEAVSVNPVDAKIRKSRDPEPGQWAVLGWDAAGVVAGVGPEAARFKAGDAVFYAGAVNRQGTDAEFHLVDERIVGPKPRTLDWAAAAALPLTAITAWEALFDRLNVRRPVPGAAPAALIVGGAGGVGSVAIQLLRTLTDLQIIATASRPETVAWVQELGAHHVINHRTPLDQEVAALGLAAPPAFVFSTTETHRHLQAIAALIAPQGRFALIDDPATLDINDFKQKCVSVHWEFMFTRSLFQTADMDAQGTLLGEVSRLVDEGKLRSTLTTRHSPINAANLREAHALIESGRSRGKVVLEGFDPE
ncbi:MAG: zinc-binding alcohol dehydrogenase family protein [Rhodospirillales bacterium]|nr:zinc-binding alcohol dehydrogenase family protein [Acetobacter sp.]